MSFHRNFIRPTIDADLKSAINFREYVQNVRLPKEDLYRSGNPFELSDAVPTKDLEFDDLPDSQIPRDNVSDSSGEVKKLVDEVTVINETLMEKFEPFFVEQNVEKKGLSGYSLAKVNGIENTAELDEIMEFINNTKKQNVFLTTRILVANIEALDKDLVKSKTELARLVKLPDGASRDKKIEQVKLKITNLELQIKVNEGKIKISEPVFRQYQQLNADAQDPAFLALINGNLPLLSIIPQEKKNILVLINKIISQLISTQDAFKDVLKKPLPGSQEVNKIVKIIDTYNSILEKWYSKYFILDDPDPTRIFTRIVRVDLKSADQKPEDIEFLKLIDKNFKNLLEKLTEVKKLLTGYKSVLLGRVGSGMSGGGLMRPVSGNKPRSVRF